ncbi:DUF4097 and DUF4098 domain-containing protein YvlB [Hydrocarboniphaga daqingensis]|uniref:DUF4097 and DUF4098 domain-containing protein YvlB n=1 Tax=Hydrocarboniphaga daqingensis TaxID=490188 RepID=A0A1M5K294_9GAMM|nr:DUF4097 family beta strand repeat-containing protein [Hydrocarboniphaga daqingensis]SHG46932.1 DUF4097 and DUF4098 domain-containing protein YvlB [Hydrocarboniphaga daqingensis]
MNLPTSAARPRRRPATDAAAGLMLALAATSASAAPPTQPPAPPVPPHHHDRYADDEDSMAGRAIDERRSLKADARVRVSNVAGSIEIVSWDKPEAYISGELGRGADKLDITGSDGNLDIVVRTPKNTRNVEGSELRIMLPVGVALNVEAVSADVIVQGIKGKVVAATVSGEMTLSLAADEVEARTVSGDVVVRAPMRNGSINTVSGDVRASGGGGRLKLETVSGDAELVGASAYSDLSLKSISGDFDVDAALTGDGRFVGETLSGEMRVRMPAATSAQVTLHTFSGDVRSAFGGAVPSGDERRERQEFKIGDGRARVDLSSFSGDIVLDKR